MYSLNTRLLLAGGVVLACFLGVTGVTLDNVFRDSAEDAVKQRLQAHIYALIAAADITDRGDVHMPPTLPEARFSIPASGLYARIEGNVGHHRWQSPSMMGIGIPFASGLKSTIERFGRLNTDGGKAVFAMSLGISWDQSNNPAKGYTFSVAESVEGYNAQVSAFRRNLWGWLGAVGVVLLTVQRFILRWGLAPVRRAARDLERIETGQRRQLEGPYPRELRGLTDNLNALLRSQREHLDRYRHTLDDLAHSLKTPLAILRGSVQKGQSVHALQEVIQQQVERMSQIVHYQLQRAATSGRSALAAPVPVKQTLGKVTASLNKVYADKHVSVKLDVSEQATFHGDEGDLMEVLGNLVDNAYKWSRRRVRIGAYRDPGGAAGRAWLVLQVDDDGPGIAPSLSLAIPRRGVRGDPTTEGHGIGLALVQDILQIYHGDLKIETNPWGGARLTVRFPA
ncbi:MAG TPA: ATP-binding protein [Gammaproteobacteria bacterium]|nr:ATP-binding protein [Gammaproteobacteria bacterium]